MKALALALALLVTAHVKAHTTILYSRADTVRADQVRGIAALYGPVVIDRALPGGVPWRQAVAASICTADVVLVLWSASAAASPEVGAEWRLAAGCAQRLVPVLLDSTPLPAELGARQAIDFK